MYAPGDSEIELHCSEQTVGCGDQAGYVRRTCPSRIGRHRLVE